MALTTGKEKYKPCSHKIQAVSKAFFNLLKDVPKIGIIIHGRRMRMRAKKPALCKARRSNTAITKLLIGTGGRLLK